MDSIRNGLGMGHLESLKNRAAYLLKDSLKIARLALVDVSNAEMMTEEATNADEWGPTTKQMAEISHSIKNPEDYLRIVHVLHKRFALNTLKFWRQIHKSLILLEYLLCHGPEDLVMEFRQDKSRIEEFTRFAYVDLNGVDRGSAIQRRAKHVLHVLMDESFYKKERTRAQKISSGISGFGNESLHNHKPTRSKSFHGTVPRSQSAFSLSENGVEGDAASLLGDEDDESNSEPDTRETCRSAHSNTEPEAGPEGEFTSPSTSETSSWRNFSSSSGVESQSASGRSTNSTCSDMNTTEESPTHFSSFPKTSQILDMDSVASELENSRTPSLLLKLPPPPPIAGYKRVMPRPSSRVRSKQPESAKRGHGNAPDLISI